MMMKDILLSYLPGIQEWIKLNNQQYKSEAISISELGSHRLSSYYDKSLLETTKVIYVPVVPFPPVESLGLGQLKNMSRLNMAGITFDDMIFIHELHKTESIHFHELIHAIQWNVLGFKDFLLVYALGIELYGYQHCPLETMAYYYQKKFDNNVRLPALAREIEISTLKIRNDVLG